VLEGFDRYKYNCVDTSPLSKYVMHPFWNKTVLLCPTWIAPNLLTLVGFICCVFHYLIPAWYDYNFTASTLNSTNPIPQWSWALVSFLLFASHTLDGIDGKQARRTGTSGPLGELFDHGCDAWAAVFITSTFYSTFGRNDDGLSISEWRMYLALWNVFFCFHLSHWEKYNTGVMYLPWAYDLSMVGGTILYALTSIFGYQAWKIEMPLGFTLGSTFEFCLYLGSMGMSVPVAIRNFYKSYRDGTGKMRPFMEAVRPLVSFLIALVLFMFWATYSPNNILEADPRMFFYVSGTLCANLSCTLIVSQMSNTRCELINILLVPLALAVALCLFIPGLLSTSELTILYMLSLVLTVFHIHYGICVVSEMSTHLNIEPLRIKNSYDKVRLISSKKAKTDAQSDSDDCSDNNEHVAVDVSDLEVCVVASNSGLAGHTAPEKSVNVLQV